MVLTTQTIEQEYYSVRQVAQLLGIGISTVHKWMHQRGLPYYLPTKRKALIKRTDLEAFLRAFKATKARKRAAAPEGRGP